MIILSHVFVYILYKESRSQSPGILFTFRTTPFYRKPQMIFSRRGAGFRPQGSVQRYMTAGAVVPATKYWGNQQGVFTAGRSTPQR